ncbi:hypothetical protein RA28_07780 [Ruegeria sp. ANG-S4]|uniref:S8 family serine peptidase n=1 Tax=Ruegeria sp. ANG-S4 TaxID=1577904 RepID=UPI00057E90A8|nr:S8 family serine peptidase [Ruegeria sp. ANG-S4]KIC45618.1 hypothetical protein RA28_07780 [Ruegeria sp. ANG-S4]
MALDLFLFAENKDMLLTLLGAADVDPNDVLPASTLSDRSQTNNPWTLVDEKGNEVEDPDPAGDRGFSVSLRELDEATKIEVFQKMRGTERADRAIGIEINPTRLDSALRGQHWCSGAGKGYQYGTRDQAERLINLSALKSAGLTGHGVNIVVVDQGINKDYVESLGGIYAGGMKAKADGQLKIPGEGKFPHTNLRKRHGSMLLRSIVKAAPNARIFDLPLLPKRIDDVGEFTVLAALAKFLFAKKHVPPNESWVFLNAWGIVNRFGESIRGDYTKNPFHPLNLLVSGLGPFPGLGDRTDVVFAAGNNGQFCADPRAPGYDRLPGNAIFGANALPDVTSVGAVRADGKWIGMSSQGPGVFGFGDERDHKPDFAAPSWFAEPQDAALRSGGTSAASAVVAGAIAALRQGWQTNKVTPKQMRAALIDSARKVDRGAWNARTGAGILDLDAAIEILTERHGPPLLS